MVCLYDVFYIPFGLSHSNIHCSITLILPVHLKPLKCGSGNEVLIAVTPFKFMLILTSKSYHM